MTRRPHGRSGVCSWGQELDETFVAIVSWIPLDGILLVQAVPHGIRDLAGTEPAFRALTALNSRLDIGGVGSWREHGAPLGWVAHPVGSFDATPESVSWTTIHAASFAMHATQAIRPRGAQEARGESGMTDCCTPLPYMAACGMAGLAWTGPRGPRCRPADFAR